MTSPRPLLLRPAVRDYAWGDPSFIPDLLGLRGHEGPCAEAWFGAHPQGPATVRPDGEPLDALLAARRQAYLGPTLAARHETLPYLLKLLAASRPLSIQTHPNLVQARAGFAREEAAGIPRDAPERCYRDANHKPEVLVALTEVHAVSGFRRGPELLEGLDSAPELSTLVPRPAAPVPEELKAFLEAYFALPDETVKPAVEGLMDRLLEEEARAAFSTEAPEYWALEASRTLFRGGPPDRGVLFLFLLHLVRLDPGEALALPPGVPHAYLRGAGVELMATSDNVLRAGLTQKHVDAAELLRIVRFEGGEPRVLNPVRGSAPEESVYENPGPGLTLLRLDLADGTRIERRVEGPQTWLNVSDATVTVRRVDVAGEEIRLERGAALLLAHGTRVRASTDGAAEVYVAGATLP